MSTLAPDDIAALFKRIISEPVAPCQHRSVVSITASGVLILRCTRCGETWRGRGVLQSTEEEGDDGSI